MSTTVAARSFRPGHAADYLRVGSAVTIVWFHASDAPGKLWGGSGLVVFVALSFIHAAQPAPLATFLRRRARRVLMPWTFWTIFYAAMSLLLRRELPPLASAWGVVAESATHLWYLPFLFVNSAALQVARPLLRSVPAPARGLVALAVGMALLLALPWLPLAAAPMSVAIWIKALPAACIGIALGSGLRRGALHQVGAIVACVAIGSWSLFHAGMEIDAIAYALGTALSALCALPVPRSRFVTKLALLTPGIYLIHPFAFLFVWRLLPAPPFWAFVLVGVMGGAAAAWVLKQNGLTRMLV